LLFILEVIEVLVVGGEVKAMVRQSREVNTVFEVIMIASCKEQATGNR
jgi:hypothetical protein